MKEIFNTNIEKDVSKKSSFIEVWENQHPVMFWWFALTTISLCSVYIMLFTKF